MRELTGALAREAEQLLRAGAIRKFGLPLQLGEQRDRLRIVARRHRGPCLGHRRLERLRWQGWVTADALDRRQRHLRRGGVQVAGDGVIPDSEPGTRIIRQREVQQPVRFRAALDRTHAQAIPLLAVDQRFGDERGRLEPLVRELHILGRKRLGLRVEVDREVADRLGLLADENLTAAAGAIDQPQA